MTQSGHCYGAFPDFAGGSDESATRVFAFKLAVTTRMGVTWINTRPKSNHESVPLVTITYLYCQKRHLVIYESGPTLPSVDTNTE
jgi:hypothetical protein